MGEASKVERRPEESQHVCPKKKSKWTQQTRATHFHSKKTRVKTHRMNASCQLGRENLAILFCCCRCCRCCCSCSAAAAAYFNQCTTTMIFIFMRQRNDLVSTYLNLHFNCLAHFMSHSSSRAKSADARARALVEQSALTQRARVCKWENARFGDRVEFFRTERASLWLQHTN